LKAQTKNNKIFSRPTVLLVCTSYLPKRNGTTLAIRSLAVQLQRHNRNVYIISRSKTDGTFWESVEGTTTLRIGVGNRKYLSSLKYFFLCLLYLNKVTSRKSSIVMHAHGILPGVTLAFNKLVRRKPFVVTFHQLPPNTARLKLLTLLQKFVCMFASIITIQSGPARSVLVSRLGENFNDKLIIIPNAMDLSPYVSHISFDEAFSSKRILYVGEVSKYKGVQLLLLAFKEIVELFPEASLHIVGKGTYLNNLKELSRNLGISKSVNFLGELDQNGVVKAYDNCSIFVLPSYYELFGTVLIEASIMRRPVVATSTVGATSVIEHGVTGIIVNKGDAKAIADAVIRLLSDKEGAKRLSDSALTHAMRLIDQERTIRRYLFCYDLLLSNRQKHLILQQSSLS
jgi:glycosyltransferase involved in cell wall biosynthesis